MKEIWLETYKDLCKDGEMIGFDTLGRRFSSLASAVKYAKKNLKNNAYKIVELECTDEQQNCTGWLRYVGTILYQDGYSCNDLLFDGYYSEHPYQ